MVKKTGEETGTEALDTGTEELETGTETQATPTEKWAPIEERLAQAQVQIDALTKERDEASKGLKTAHSKLSDKDRELKKRAETDTRMDGLEGTLEAFGGLLSERLNISDDELTEKKVDYRKVFKDELTEQRKQREQVQRTAQQQEYGTQARATYAKAKEVFPDDDVKLLRIERFLDQGMLDDAEALIAKTEGKATDTKETKMESEEEKFQKRLDEEKRKWMEESGMLESETGGPSGSVGSKEEARAQFIAGEITEKEAINRGVTFT